MGQISTSSLGIFVIPTKPGAILAMWIDEVLRATLDMPFSQMLGSDIRAMGRFSDAVWYGLIDTKRTVLRTHLPNALDLFLK